MGFKQWPDAQNPFRRSMRLPSSMFQEQRRQRALNSHNPGLPPHPNRQQNLKSPLQTAKMTN